MLRLYIFRKKGGFGFLSPIGLLSVLLPIFLDPHMIRSRHKTENKRSFLVKEGRSGNLYSAGLLHEPSCVPEANDFYLRGLKFVQMGTRANLDSARQTFGLALKMDPQFALAHAGISNCYSLFYSYHDQDSRYLDLASTYASQSLELCSDLPEGYVAQANLHYTRHQYEDALRKASLAVKLLPACQGGYYVLGHSLLMLKEFKEAAVLHRKAMQHCSDYNVYIPYLDALLQVGSHDQFERLLLEENARLYQELRELPENSRARILLASNLAKIHKKEEAYAELQQAVVFSFNDAMILYNAACVYGILGRKAEAILYLKKAVQYGMFYWERIASDPDLSIIRNEPEFRRLIEALRSRDPELGCFFSDQGEPCGEVLKERGRIARELHDSVGQNLSAAIRQLEAAAIDPSMNSDTQKHVVKAAILARESMTQIRQSVFDLRSSMSRKGLLEALKDFTQKIAVQKNFKIVFRLKGKERQLLETVKSHLLRIAQEAIANCAQHSGATRIAITLKFFPDSVYLHIRDNGRGFSADSSKAGNHFGLAVMRERAKVIGGRLKIRSIQNRGTEVLLYIPQ